MAPGVGISGDHQHLMPQLDQAVPENLHMGDYPIDMGQVSFGKQSNAHDKCLLTNAFPRVLHIYV